MTMLCLVCDTDRPYGAAVLTGFPTHFCPTRPLHGPAGPPGPPTCQVVIKMVWAGPESPGHGWVMVGCGTVLPCPDHFDGTARDRGEGE